MAAERVSQGGSVEIAVPGQKIGRNVFRVSVKRSPQDPSTHFSTIAYYRLDPSVYNERHERICEFPNDLRAYHRIPELHEMGYCLNVKRPSYDAYVKEARKQGRVREPQKTGTDWTSFYNPSFSQERQRVLAGAFLNQGRTVAQVMDMTGLSEAEVRDIQTNGVSEDDRRKVREQARSRQ